MKKPKQIRRTIFIYCEGSTDFCFAKYLKSLYCRHRLKEIRLKSGSGGEVVTCISEIKRNAQVRDFKEKYILWDSDKKTGQKLRDLQKKAEKDDIKVIWKKPCLEGLLLRILRCDQSIKETSKKCKDIFHKDHDSSNKGITEDLLVKLFPKHILDETKDKIEELKQLIELMDDGNTSSPASQKIAEKEI